MKGKELTDARRNLLKEQITELDQSIEDARYWIDNGDYIKSKLKIAEDDLNEILKESKILRHITKAIQDIDKVMTRLRGNTFKGKEQ